MNDPFDKAIKNTRRINNYPENINATKWIELHENLQDLLAGYIDNELEDGQIMLVEAHVLGCEACRNDLGRQQALSQRLEPTPSSRMSNKVHQKIDKALEDTVLENVSSWIKPLWFSSALLYIKRSLPNVSLTSALGVSGWSVALLLGLIIVTPQFNIDNSSGIPMIQDALTEYYEMEGKSLPVTDTHNDGSLTAPLSWPNARLLSTWATRIAGSPAQVFALRSGHNIIFQYQISEAVFFRNSDVRSAISSKGSYAMQDNKTAVLALPLTNSGVLVVGATDSLPKAEKIIFSLDI